MAGRTKGILRNILAMSFVLLQAFASSAVADSVIELSSAQISSLDEPAVVRVQCMSKQKKEKKSGPMRLICEVKANDKLDDDHANLSASTLKVLGVKSNECIRLSFVDSLVPSAAIHQSIPDNAERWKDLKKREALVEKLTRQLEKLTHERNWYRAQAERFRSELTASAEELHLVMEERRVAVAMYTKSRMIEQEFLGLKLNQIKSPSELKVSE